MSTGELAAGKSGFLKGTCCWQVWRRPILWYAGQVLIFVCHKLIDRIWNYYIIYTEFITINRLRCSLLMALITCLNGVWLVENPGTTLIHYHPAFMWLVQSLEKVGVKVPSSQAEHRCTWEILSQTFWTDPSGLKTQNGSVQNVVFKISCNLRCIEQKSIASFPKLRRISGIPTVLLDEEIWAYVP